MPQSRRNWYWLVPHKSMYLIWRLSVRTERCPQELVRLNGGTLSVVSKTEMESLDGSHGSIFTVTLPLGKDHLSPRHVDDTVPEGHRHQVYARSIVEEATHWSRPSDSVKTPSDSSDSGGSSSDGSRLDSST